MSMSPAADTTRSMHTTHEHIASRGSMHASRSSHRQPQQHMHTTRSSHMISTGP